MLNYISVIKRYKCLTKLNYIKPESQFSSYNGINIVCYCDYSYSQLFLRYTYERYCYIEIYINCLAVLAYCQFFYDILNDFPHLKSFAYTHNYVCHIKCDDVSNNNIFWEFLECVKNKSF